jgi:WD40 repeat protein
LWDHRDRERGLLTREAYEHIGGVGGALAQHAEATLEKIGQDNIPIVREIFRNLVTSQGTRASRTRDDLLSVFEKGHDPARAHDPPNRGHDSEAGHVLVTCPPSSVAAQILDTLIDARLLTSYEVPSEDDEEPQQRIEIIHESLLTSWPRLVRWQTQDADSAQLRDQLRQVAQLWNERGQPEDLLWTGTSFQEYELWSERYSGGLSSSEESFTHAMKTKAQRRKKQKRLAFGGIVVALLAVLAVVGSFWQRAEGEARRAEAQKLLALGQLELESYPTAALAYATKSLELADTEEGRMAVLEALWKGPPALIAFDGVLSRRHEQSPNGRWLVHDTFSPDGRANGFRLANRDGSGRTVVRSEGMMTVASKFFGDDEGHYLTISFVPDQGGLESTIWSPSKDESLGSVVMENPWVAGRRADGTEILVLGVNGGEVGLYSISLDGSSRLVDPVDLPPDFPGMAFSELASTATGDWLAALVGDEVRVAEIGEEGVSGFRLLGHHPDASKIHVDPVGRFVATADRSGEIRLWSFRDARSFVGLEGPKNLKSLSVTPDGTLLFARAPGPDENLQQIWIWDTKSSLPVLLRRLESPASGPVSVDSSELLVLMHGAANEVLLWSLRQPTYSQPLRLRGRAGLNWISIGHEGRWLTASDQSGVLIWPLTRQYPAVVPRLSASGMAFDIQGRWLASGGLDGSIMIWPLDGDVPAPPQTIIADGSRPLLGLVVSPDGSRILAGMNPDGGGSMEQTLEKGGGPLLISLQDGEALRLPDGFLDQTWGVAISPDGRLGAAIGGQIQVEENLIRVWDLDEETLLSELKSSDVASVASLEFSSNERLLAAGEEGLRSWNVKTRESEVLYPGPTWRFDCSRGCERVVLLESADPEDMYSPGHGIVFNLVSGESVRLQTHGSEIENIAVDATGMIVATTDTRGQLRVGSTSGGEPHLLVGHLGKIEELTFDPMGRWLATAGSDETIRFWPIPDISEPPLHTLAHDDLIAKLHGLTNLRLVEDESGETSTGWMLEVGPFPGWQELPTW